MKKLMLVFISLLVVSLSACEEVSKELDYSDFPNNIITSYEAAESEQSNKYIVYYYSINCGHCLTVKPDILDFFNDFDTLPFFIYNITEAHDVSGLEEFIGTPTVFVMSDGVVSESYIGSDNILDFIIKYKDIEVDYNTFNSLHLTTYQEVLEIEQNIYILYYYLDNCPHCMIVKDDFLTWVFTKSVGDIYFMNGANVIDPDNVPTELIILNSGTPIIVIMSDGEFTGEYYSGSEEILEYILAIGDGKIVQLE